ncbi:MAG TPA: hypothetical protein VFG09_00620 [Thermodesulfovibrionales bacterium]|nr:hypothetical protein [Thermodesulfovibrionales bacterium]
MAQGGCDMSLADPGRPDDDQIAWFRQPLGMHELQDISPGDLGIELPVKVVHQLGPLNAGSSHEVFDPFLLSSLIFPSKELLQELLVLLGQGGHIRE